MAWRRKVAVLYVSITIAKTAIAVPTIAFPFNSQVPLVARVNEPYRFEFSESTFAPNPENYTYSISEQAAWLSMDSTTRTLSGTPKESDAGASIFTLSATDGTGAAHMQCTLIVSTDPAPLLEGDISEQLAATVNLSSSEPPIVTLLPSSRFHFAFRQDSFIDMVQRRLYYYATLTDHTPLPSWLLFDDSNLTFSGTAPMLSAFPQAWSVSLVASDVIGFAGATATFALAINTEQLSFEPPEQNLSISSGQQLDFILLQNQLFRNGAPVRTSNLSKAEASPVPAWLSFDPATFGLSGHVPANASNTTVSVTATDELGDTATAVVNLVSGDASLFAGTIGTLTAYAGQAFDYHFPSTLFSQSDVEFSVIFPPSATWLHYNATSRELQGDAPSQPSPTSVSACIVATAPNSRTQQTQDFGINVLATAGATATVSPTSTRVVNGDVEKHAQAEASEQMTRSADAPPQIALDLPSRTNSKRSRWLKRFSRFSHASWRESLGVCHKRCPPSNRKSIRLVGQSDSIADNRSVAEKRQSFIRNRASTSIESPLFAHGTRACSNPREKGNASTAASAAGSVRRARRGRSTLKSYSESSSLEPQTERESRQLSTRVRSAFAPNFPRAITQSTMEADEQEDSSSGFETVTTSTTSGDDWRAQLALPRHQRSWVVPGEASPTPPPAPASSRQRSSTRRTTPSTGHEVLRNVHRQPEQRVSDLGLTAKPESDHSTGKAPTTLKARPNRLSEPAGLLSNDSVIRTKIERPKLVQTNSKRPVSVEQARRLSSFQAVNQEPDAQAGGEMWEDIQPETQMEGSGLVLSAPPGGVGGTQRSDRSGPAFL
ncbi:hypothetical protein BAUCODRAFT_68516 [Baudoinia panamericana UAMH 10762]|uniref:Dystroglycan-type cadherin-like domain-containing protein n=1 Tax=Baudoinia panamericana (strain UAMH 10762) TaxID=717646 RepID=M2NE99_BAUPA|nr:uncharacterized protein BAUCODRAFT_68516 [Baudoinia panamericana UAMH 10762]EMC97544.1 hypothetical protein BAUCODRAFT_68516 [Baudoinia panamericana UAMH 10762]